MPTITRLQRLYQATITTSCDARPIQIIGKVGANLYGLSALVDCGCDTPTPMLPKGGWT